MIPKTTVDQIIDSARIEEVIEDFVNLKRRGVNMIGLCPFHDEKTPSFTVSPAKNIYKCFGCGKGGFPVNFIMDHENMGYVEALKYLANKYNITIEEEEVREEDIQARHLADSLYIINEFTKNYFTDQLLNTDEGKSVGLGYFKERGYGESTIKKFDLGYANSIPDDLISLAKSKNYNIDHFGTLGLATKNNIDFFRSRVMFAIHNLSGKVIAFAGRTLSSDKKVPKYMNSPESEIYNKSKSLYGLYFAKTAIRKANACIMVEGYTDVITLHQYGIENVVASSGTSLTSGQIHLVKRYTNTMKIIYDGDPAGIKAALRGVDLVLEQGMDVKIIMLPEGEDPDSFMKLKGTSGFTQYMNDEEKDFLFFKSELLLNEAGNDPIQRTLVMKDIIGSIAKIPDQMKRAVYLQESARMLNISEQILITETNKVIQNDEKRRNIDNRRSQSNTDSELRPVSNSDDQIPATQAKKVLLNDDPQEKDIIRIIVNLGDKLYNEEKQITVAAYIIANIREDIDKFENELYRKMITLAINAIDRGESVTPELYANQSDENIRNLTVELMADPYTYADWEKKGVILQTQKLPDLNFERDSYQSILRFKLAKIKKFIEIVENKIKAYSQEDQASEDYILNIKVLQKLLAERNTIAKELQTIVF